MTPLLLRAAIILSCLVIFRVIYSLFAAVASRLRSIPGPFIARFTKGWYFWKVWRGDFEFTNIDLHKKYGPIVRVAPDHYVIDDPAAIKTIYGIGSKFTKGDWYKGWKHPSPDRWTLFPDDNIKRHAETRKRFQAMYSLSTLVTYEQYVDNCTKLLVDKLAQFAREGREVDMCHWFQCYAFDVIGEITYGSRFGFLDAGEDIENTMRALHGTMVYGTMVGIYPQFHAPIYYAMSRFKSTPVGGRAYLQDFVTNLIARRKSEREDPAFADLKRTEEGATAPQTFLDKLLIAHEKDPQKVTAYHIFMMGMSNIIAGSDTTSISLSGTLYHLLRTPAAVQNLRDEINHAITTGNCSVPNVTFKESQNMPYLQAVMKEALRMHSATGLPLWRVVPEGGEQISGKFFPAGSVVGINTWCAHYNEDVFGTDAGVFRPERWIEAEKIGGDKLHEMNAYYMPFGLGSRTCIGRHISLLEMNKLIPQIINRFEFEPIHKDRKWKTENYWFVKPKDFIVRIKDRGVHV
ncbi:putative cytochrome P450 pisatin demethylase [Xylogone sp. PMI_703]|nr:putative cytochrome P450 pisatin demethylase [Xylogone sp. PMI_703]